jgi:hypothetical protein
VLVVIISISINLAYGLLLSDNQKLDEKCLTLKSYQIKKNYLCVFSCDRTPVRSNYRKGATGQSCRPSILRCTMTVCRSLFSCCIRILNTVSRTYRNTVGDIMHELCCQLQSSTTFDFQSPGHQGCSIYPCKARKLHLSVSRQQLLDNTADYIKKRI